MDELSFEQIVRNQVYAMLLRDGSMPKVATLACELEKDEAEIRSALQSLYEQKALALMPRSGEILMASPWSAVPTAFVTEAGGWSWFANCAWDALAIPAAMGCMGKVTASCACCGEAMSMEVVIGELLCGDGVLHISRPAKYWWDDIHFT